jgi:tetratricopeptide (TPR) repeat protein
MTGKGRLQLILLSVAVLVAFASSALAQTTAQTTAQTNQQQVPPDRKAYSEANAIKEPAKKIEALEKFVTDFPNSTSVYMAHQAIFDTLVKNYPNQKDKILEQGGKVLDKAPERSKINLYNSLGSQLCDAGILLDEAEKFVRTGLTLMDQESAKQASPTAQANPNARANPNVQATPGRSRATFLVTLGRIYIKQGKLDAAEKNLKDALAANPKLSTATLGLAEVYNRRGDVQNALTAYIEAAATSKMPADARQQLNALYAKSHGLEEILDAKYREANPPPFTVEPYKPSAKRTDRVVLAEVFTGSGCPPCVAADLAADLAMERYSRQELAVLIYHEHIPQPDPMTTPQTTARFNYYTASLPRRGVPTLAIDGVTTVGGGARSETKRVYDPITRQIEKGLEVPAGAQLKLDTAMDGTTVRASATVSKITSKSQDLKLHIVLAEEMLRYTGENGIRLHPMVVRSMAESDGGSQGLIITSKDSQTFTWNFDLQAISAAIKKHLDEYEASGHRGNSFTFTERKYEIDPKDLVVAAFVQDEKTKAILQSIIVKVKPQAVGQ